jgi:hypothetical protein
MRGVHQLDAGPLRAGVAGPREARVGHLTGSIGLGHLLEHG